MSKRTIDLSLFSTIEIQQMRNDEIVKKKRKTGKDKVDLEEIKPMAVNAMRDFILNSKSTTEMLTKHLRIQLFQTAGDEDLVLFELHGYAKFNERTLMKNLLDRTIGRVGAGFMAKLVRYAAGYCIEQYRILNCKPWFNLLKLRVDYDWPAVFQQCSKAFPDEELALLITMVTLIPDQQPKFIPRIYALMAANDDIPNCYVWLTKMLIKNFSKMAPNKNDMEICTGRYLNKVYDHVKPMMAKNSSVNVLTEAQRKFALISEELLSAALKIVNEQNVETMKSLIVNPRCDIDETPCPLFVEYFVQFVKLGVFNFSNADKLIAWNYYYDDRWMGYDRPDLFGTNFELYDQFVYTESFKHRKNMSMEHPHMMELTLATRAYDWMAKDNNLYDSLMEKYGDEDLIQFFAISLTFCGFFDHMIDLYEKQKDNMKTNEGFMCLHMCYLFACTKKPGMLKEAILTWVTVVRHAIEWKYLACIAFHPKTFPLPAFVRVKFAGQFATRMLRNCLWETAKAEGVDGWKKYGLLILLFCESLEDSFLNHQMVRILFQKIEVENWNFILRPGFERCIRRGDTFNHIMTNVYIENEEMLQELREQNFLPAISDFPKSVPTPGYLRIFQMLKEKDNLFAEIIDWIPAEIFGDDNVTEVSTEISDKEAADKKNSPGDSSDSSPAPTIESEDATRRKSLSVEMLNDLPFNSAKEGLQDEESKEVTEATSGAENQQETGQETEPEEVETLHVVKQEEKEPEAEDVDLQGAESRAEEQLKPDDTETLKAVKEEGPPQEAEDVEMLEVANETQQPDAPVNPTENLNAEEEKSQATEPEAVEVQESSSEEAPMETLEEPEPMEADQEESNEEPPVLEKESTCE